ncbi:transmembrane protein 164 isoform X1 [Cryptotermes secundus]|uniref:transmembrane protein 164 isoform X1 n=1 Tax=Cryptotermes secundus TaxID=105785 RepID=UPI000CD7C56C|nr:transmembrane protein 164 isoform X1 [Cryptotermes secundus]XP_023710521.1 transmembrane protein 164 isoform X1 [Cryptotermes secundus]XP_023710530.1 transmembrane protein 164 isoform X1 [Cryptotermes secundus]XP_023710538.1 transmembrane protein 164 isoform X1 [Cryptotermes secundus]
MFEWAYSGVNASLPGNGGPECASFLSLSRRITETGITLAFAVICILWGYRNLSLIPQICSCGQKNDTGKRVLLVVISLMWGMEIGFKFASRTVIYLFNPCHITTALQIYLLAAQPSKLVTIIYRLQLNFLNGAVLACAFPWTETRVFPFEKSIYWIQHSMMVIVPYYLLQLGGAYNVERYSDFSWCLVAYGMNLLYHFVILQAVAIPLQVNLNLMLCPMELDPFYGPYYRIIAVAHQAILCPLTCKVFCAVSSLFATPKQCLCDPSCECNLEQCCNQKRLLHKD